MVANWAAQHPPPTLVLGDRREPLLDLSLRLITPMFGGGVAAGEPDPSLPVRASAIRGQLRFWWRACVAAPYASTEQLFADEAAIWGQAHRPGIRDAGPSSVEIDVSEVCPPEPALRPCQVERQGRNGRLDYAWDLGDRPDPRDPLGYALWPFGVSRQRKQPADAVWTLDFRLKMYPAAGTTPARQQELTQAVTAAVWAWVTFGGLGARTRRGCGAFHCRTAGFHPPAGADPMTWVQAEAAKHIQPGPRSLLVPVLGEARIIVGHAIGEPIAAWRQAIALMRNFRQAVGFARHEGTEQRGRPGISRWPEASSLRQHVPIDDPAHPTADAAHRYYPRADLGLPILFQRMGIGKDITVTMAGTGAGTERMASPVILKPLALHDGRAVPLALLLNAPHVWDEDTPGVTLNKTVRVANADLDDSVKSLAVPPLRGQPTARDGFMAFASERLRAPEHTIRGAS